jgi:hypothetical protein
MLAVSMLVSISRRTGPDSAVAGRILHSANSLAPRAPRVLNAANMSAQYVFGDSSTAIVGSNTTRGIHV